MSNLEYQRARRDKSSHTEELALFPLLASEKQIKLTIDHKQIEIGIPN